MIFFVQTTYVRLDTFIKQHTTFSIRAIRRMCKEGSIFVNERNHSLPSLVKKGDVIKILQNTQTFPTIPIIEENDNFIALFKQSALHTLSLAGQDNYSLQAFCLYHFPKYILCNRLDFYTSGIILLAKTQKAHTIFKEAEKKAETQKLYYAIVQGIAYSTIITNTIDTDNKRKSLVLDSLSKDKARYTHCRPLTSSLYDNNGNICSLVEVLLHRGARHQIRTHLAFATMPLFGDTLYSTTKEKIFFLHNHTLSFNSITFTTPTPPLWITQWGDSIRPYLER